MLTALFGLTACSSGVAGTAEEGKTLFLSLNQSETHPSDVALTDFGDRLSAATDGHNLYTQTGPIEEPADLDGMKIRVQESDRAVFLEEWETTVRDHTQLWKDETEKAVDDAEFRGRSSTTSTRRPSPKPAPRSSRTP